MIVASKSSHLLLNLPEGVRSLLHQNWHLFVVEQLFWIYHVEEVELCEYGDRGLLPCIVGRCALLHNKLLKNNDDWFRDMVCSGFK